MMPETSDQIVIGGIIGSLELSLLSALVWKYLSPQAEFIVGYWLLAGPIGAFIGVATVADILRLEKSAAGYKYFFLSHWCASTILGFVGNVGAVAILGIFFGGLTKTGVFLIIAQFLVVCILTGVLYKNKRL